MFIATERYLGPAEVVETGKEGLRVSTPSGVVDATLALAVPYDPRPGDVVLLIAEEEAFIIGVLKGTGPTRLEAPGDLVLSARGKVSVEGARGVEVSGPDVTLKATKLEMVANKVFGRFSSAYQWVKCTLHTVAGRTRTVTEGSATLRAERIVEVAKKDVRIDGKEILLG
ncbi:MAG: DUF3540 domain-containing protein [Planctomycetota bacterium]|jgi:hypothetical protein